MQLLCSQKKRASTKAQILHIHRTQIIFIYYEVMRLEIEAS